MSAYSTVSKPYLFDSQLKFRLGLAKKRLESYPLDSMNFVMMDLERPKMRSRHAHWCSYDLTGRNLYFYSLAEGIDGKHIDRLPELFERIMHNRRPSGVFGNTYSFGEEEPESCVAIGTHFLSGLVNYYALTGDMRALNAAEESVEAFIGKWDLFKEKFANPNGSNQMKCWIVEPLAELYRETGKGKYLDLVRRITYECVGLLDGAHAHGYFTTLRGIMKAAIYSKDEELAAFVKVRRQEVLDRNCLYPNGDISEALPKSHRNEGCAISDWIMLNLFYAQYYGDDSAYEIAEHSLYNALYYNQFVTGGFGHRFFANNGYKTYVEEAWWCCTQNSGMCLTEVARNAVTIYKDQLKLNFLLPGRYTLPSPKGEITVTVTTKYPLKCETKVVVIGTKEDILVRVPGFIKGYTCTRVEIPLGYELYLDGRMGHYTEDTVDGTILKYGPLMLAPMIYLWEPSKMDMAETSVPEGYAHENMSSNACTLLLENADEDGFYHLRHDPLPEWSVFEEGEMAGISGGEVVAGHVPVQFPNGEIVDMYFQPLLSATSNLTLLDIPTIFSVKTKKKNAGSQT